jgi:carboxylesterase
VTGVRKPLSPVRWTLPGVKACPPSREANSLEAALTLPLDNAKTGSFTLPPAGEAGARAVLLLHGFSGSPWEVRPLGEALAARGFHVEAPRLPGHGTTPEALESVTGEDWLAAAQQALLSLSTRFAEVSIAGLSMGGLLALVLAAREPALVRGLVLMAPVMRLRASNARALHRVRNTALVRLLPRWVKKGPTDIELEEVRAQSPQLSRYPLARVLDLFTLQALAQRSVPAVRCPSLVLVALNDRVVDPAGVLALQASLPRSRLVRLHRGGHIIPRDADRATALSEISEFLDTS